MPPSLIKITREGKPIGEYSLAELGRAIRKDSVLLSDHYWRPGMTDWERVQYIAEDAEEVVDRLDALIEPPRPPKGYKSNAKILMAVGVVLLMLGFIFNERRGEFVEFKLRNGVMVEVYKDTFFTLTAPWLFLGAVVLLWLAYLGRKR
jgi:hypothetical protein